MDTLKKLTELIPFLEPYPTWVKVLVGAWTIMSATLALALLFAPREHKAPAPSQLSGRVRSTQGAAIAAAAVELALGAQRLSALTDSEGAFSLETGDRAGSTSGRIRIAASGYRTYERLVRLGADTADLGLFTLQYEPGDMAGKDDDPAAQLAARQAAALEPPVDLAERYRAIADAGNAGVVKLLSDAAVRANRSVLDLQGEGRFYSFLRRSHEAGHGSDINFEQGKFSTGFAGLDYGYFLNVGAPSFADLAAAAQDPPAWLAKPKQEAWRFMWTYAPPGITVEVRRAQREARNRTVGNVSVAETVAAVPGTSYLLRSISFNDSDLLVAVRAERLCDDGSIVLVWRILQVFDTPVASGPEPEL